MPRRHTHPAPHPPLTPRSLESQVEIEATATGYAFRINGGPRRHTRPGQAGFDACRQLDALIHVQPRTAQEARELARLERELHEDLLEIETLAQEHDLARLYA